MCGHDFAWLAGRASRMQACSSLRRLAPRHCAQEGKSFTNLLTIVHELAECGVFVSLSKFMNE